MNHKKEIEVHETNRKKLIAPPNQSFEGLNTGNLNFKHDEEKGGGSVYIHHDEPSVPRFAEPVTVPPPAVTTAPSDAQPK